MWGHGCKQKSQLHVTADKHTLCSLGKTRVLGKEFANSQVLWESRLIQTDHSRPVQFHRREVYWGWGRTKGNDKDEERKGWTSGGLWCNHFQVKVGSRSGRHWECMVITMATNAWVPVSYGWCHCHHWIQRWHSTVKLVPECKASSWCQHTSHLILINLRILSSKEQ